nr:MAG TPA: hypothetical protein [Caudoviricetes sp.]
MFLVSPPCTCNRNLLPVRNSKASEPPLLSQASFK